MIIVVLGFYYRGFWLKQRRLKDVHKDEVDEDDIIKVYNTY